MISKNTCDDCGTLLVPGARFCRQCGKLLADPSNSSSVTEATTRVLDAPAANSPGYTQYVNSGPTGPAYMAPGESPFGQGSATTSLQKKGRTGKFLLVGFALILLFVSVISSVIIAGLWNRPDFRRGGRRPSRPVVSVPDETRRPPSLPDTGPPPLVPPPGGAPATSSNQLIYPGAETVLSVDSGRVLQLRTGDSFEKVFAWYSSKLQPAQIIRPPGNETAIIKAEKVAAVITAVDGQLTIMLKQDAP